MIETLLSCHVVVVMSEGDPPQVSSVTRDPKANHASL
jgi:hypothetical protein